MNPDNKLESLKKIFATLGKHKTAIILFVILTTSIVFFSINKRETLEDVSPTKLTPIVAEVTPTPSAAFYINTIANSVPVVNGISWNEDMLFYSNSKGVFDASKNTPLLNEPIKQPSWSKNGKVLFQNNNNWSVYDTSTNKTSKIPHQFTYPSISPNGDYVIDSQGSNLFLVNLNKNIRDEINMSNNVSGYVWSETSKYFAVLTSINQENIYKIEVFNNKLEKQGSVELNTPTEIIALAPEGDLILVSQNDSLDIIDADGKKQALFFKKGSQYTSFWIGSNQIFIIETTYNDKGSQQDFFWLYTLNTKKLQYLTNSLPVPGKINTNIQISVNNSLDVIAMAESNGKVWILSLLPGKVAVYSDKGVAFISVANKGDL